MTAFLASGNGASARSSRDRIASRVVKEGLDAFLVTDLSNVAYLTGFGGDSSYLIITPTSVKFLSDARYEQQTAEECPGLDAYFRASVSAGAPNPAAATALWKQAARREALRG